jgi:hypothetical protein
LVIETLIRLPDWPYRASSSEKLVHIVVCSRETWNCRTAEVTESSANISYGKTNGNKEYPVFGLHYDFDKPVKPQHPVFHAQLGTIKFEQAQLDQLKTIGFRKTIVEPRPELYSNPRIPTPFMGLGSVLLAIVADHLPKEAYDQFLSAIRKNPLMQWNAACPAWCESISRTGGFHLHAHHWY